MNANNNVILLGRLTADPEVKQIKDGVSVLNFSLAVQRNKDTTHFFDCTAWRQTAEFIGQWFGKGDMLMAAGSLIQRRWQMDTGENRSKVEVEVQSVAFAGSKSDKATESTKPAKQAVTEDDIPF